MFVLHGTAIDVPVKIVEFAKNYGASNDQIDVLLGIAYAETNFDPDAIGDSGYSNGAFQAERTSGATLKNQVNTAYTHLKQQESYLAPIYNELKGIVDSSKAMVARYHRSFWQLNPLFIKNWLKNVSERVAAAKELIEISQQSMDVKQAMGIDGYLDIDDMFSFAAAAGTINIPALVSGQDRFLEYMEPNNYNPIAKYIKTNGSSDDDGKIMVAQAATGGLTALAVAGVVIGVIWKKFRT
jgi:hypothetical protein